GRVCVCHFGVAVENALKNRPQYKNGGVIWEELIRPTRIDLERVLAHPAISLIYRPRQDRLRVYCYDIESLDQEVHARGSNHVAVGRLRVHALTTCESAEASFVVIHYGGPDSYTVLSRA